MEKIKVGAITFAVGKKYIYSFENKTGYTEAIVKIIELSDGHCKIQFHGVCNDNTGNEFFNYMLKTGGTMNASYCYLTEIDELPKGCGECKYYDTIWDKCAALNENNLIKLHSKRSSFCPLDYMEN